MTDGSIIGDNPRPTKLLLAGWVSGGIVRDFPDSVRRRQRLLKPVGLQAARLMLS